MKIQTVPEAFNGEKTLDTDLFIYDYKMSSDVFKSKVNLSHHMFSFLQTGVKQVHFPDASVTVSEEQSLLIRSGNCIWSEMLSTEDYYFCRLLFFSDSRLKKILRKLSKPSISKRLPSPYFIIQNDEYIHGYLASLSTVISASHEHMEKFLAIKFEELMVYLINKYEGDFENFLRSMIHNQNSDFKTIIENNINTSLKIEEIAFLCHMSPSTFKRNFLRVYGSPPGKWFRYQRMINARELLREGKLKASDIYLDFGYSNLSNFSAAYKKLFGYSPNNTPKNTK